MIAAVLVAALNFSPFYCPPATRCYTLVITSAEFGTQLEVLSPSNIIRVRECSSGVMHAVGVIEIFPNGRDWGIRWFSRARMSDRERAAAMLFDLKPRSCGAAS